MRGGGAPARARACVPSARLLTAARRHHPARRYEHWFHHAKSAGSTPYYTGFFFKLWDNLAGTVSAEKCVCSRCQVGEGLRSEKAWKKLKKPDYGKLLTVDFWLEAGDSAKGE